MSDTDQLIADLVNCMKQAVESGDWIVDGACDPDSVIQRAEYHLRSAFYTENSVDGHWQASSRRG